MANAEVIAGPRPTLDALHIPEGSEILSPRSPFTYESTIFTPGSDWLDEYFDAVGIAELAPSALLVVGHT